MTTERKVIRAKVGLLELAKQLGNVSQACKIMGYSRDSFYRFQEPGLPWLSSNCRIALFLARSDAGRDLAVSVPVTLLIGAQVFRVIVELFIHQFWSVGLLPKMLTYEGANFDIVVGLSAPVVAWLIANGRLSSTLALAWNVLGLLLLANIVVRAILTTPALQALVTEVPNRALGMFPFTFIPSLMVPLALTLHVLAIRALLAGVRAKRAPQPYRYARV